MEPAEYDQSEPFVHPGLLHSRDELAFIKQKLATGEEPWKSVWQKLQSADEASLTYTPKPCAKVVRGVWNRPNIGSSDMSNDSVAAYAHALQWTLTGKRAHADKAIEILKAWSATLQSVSGHDAGLLVGMDGVKFCNVAELVRYPDANWLPDDQKCFEQMLRQIFYPVLENARSLQRGLGKDDNEKLSEYFQSIRDIETRLSKEEKWIGVDRPDAPIDEPRGGLQGKGEVGLMYDLLVAAFQTDSTRVITYRQPGGGVFLNSIGVDVHPHDMSHYVTTKGEKLAASQKRDLTYSTLLAGLIDKLKATREADGSRLFDHIALAYGSNIRSGHQLSNCPTLLTGGGADIKLGENIVVPEDTPLCNAWLTMLHGVGVNAERHGDSTGVLKQILA